MPWPPGGTRPEGPEIVSRCVAYAYEHLHAWFCAVCGNRPLEPLFRETSWKGNYRNNSKQSVFDMIFCGLDLSAKPL